MADGARRLVLASRNRGKLAELSALLAPHDWQADSLSVYTDTCVDEDAPSYIENALLKARAASAASALPAIADDSGLEVDALDGAPGVRSARYAGARANDQQNLELLLEALSGVSEIHRGACFRCLAVYLERPDDPAPLIAEGVWRGRILSATRGGGGFGYDPVFYVPEQGCSAAELDPEQKNRLSHRGQAVRALILRLLDRLS